MSNIKKPLIAILGPTGSGKTELAIKLAKKYNGEIVSADSRQIYKGMDIGTAKPTKKQQAAISHHLIDIVEPDQEFTLSDYKKMAIEKIKDIQQRGKIPFLVGGTGLYIQAVVDNLEIPQVKADKKLREKLEKMDLPELLNLLKKLDPETAKTIDIYNKRRLVRAIEVCKLTNKPFSKQRKKGKPLFNVLQIGIKIDKKTLDQRINQRVEKMFKAGLINEVKNLLKKYLPARNASQASKPACSRSDAGGSSLPASNVKRSFAGWPALSGIGYQEIITYLNTELTLEQVKDLIKLHTRQYAKRQMTWFRRNPAPEQVQCRTGKKIKWVENYAEAEKLVKNFISP